MKRSRMVLFAALGGATLLASAAATCAGDTTTRVETMNGGQTGITVSGMGKATSKPDVARLTLGVSVLGDSVQEARDRAAGSLDGMLRTLKTNGVADKDIQTQQFNIQPEYDYSNNKQQLRGFRINNVVTATVRNINSTSKVVDDAVTAGGSDTQIQSIAFTIDKPDDLKRQAREAAVADAKSKAETLARAAGVSLGDAITISEGGYTPLQLQYSQRAASDTISAPSTPIQPGELDISVDVSVTWAIK